MTLEELKKIDRVLRAIPYPFGSNFLLLCGTLSETARRLEIPVSDIIRQYADWKRRSK